HAQQGVTSSDLRGEGFIRPRSECSFQLMELAGLEPSTIRRSIRYYASDSATILAMVREGLGITLLPRMMLPTKLEGVVALPLDLSQQLEIGLGIRAREAASPAARLFIQTAQEWAEAQAFTLNGAGARPQAQPALR